MAGKVGGARVCGTELIKPEQGGVAGKVGGARVCGIKP